MAPGYLNYGMSTAWGMGQWPMSVATYATRPFVRLWENFRQRDRYELARVRRVPVTPTRVLAVFALPRVRMYVLRINSAGRPGRRRRRLAVQA